MAGQHGTIILGFMRVLTCYSPIPTAVTKLSFIASVFYNVEKDTFVKKVICLCLTHERVENISIPD
jgi:hypothetical protein